MSTATQIPAIPSPTEMLLSLSPAERLKLLRELVKICFDEGMLDKPLLVTEEDDLFRGYVLAMFPKTMKPLPPLTDEERVELRRRIANRHNAISHDEFVVRVRKLIRELPENAQS